MSDGATLVPIIYASGIIFLMNFSEDKKAWPIYITIGKIVSSTWNKALKHAKVLFVLVPVPQKMLDIVVRDAR